MSRTAKGSKNTNKARREPDEQTLTEFKEAFKIFDSKNTGQIDARELKAIMKAFGVEIKKQDIRDLFADHGKDIKEGINFSQFTTMMSSKMGPRDSKEEIQKVFKMFDEDSVGRISFKNLRKISNQIGEKLSDDQLRQMLEEADRDGDGMLNFDEFYRIMRRRTDPLDDLDSDSDDDK